MRVLRYIAVLVLVFVSLPAAAENHWPDLSYEQFGDRFGHIEAMARSRADDLYVLVSRLNQDTSGYEPALLVKKKGGCWQAPEFIMGDSGKTVRNAKLVVSPMDSQIHVLFVQGSSQSGFDFYLASRKASGWLVRSLETQSFLQYIDEYNPQSDLAIDSVGHLHAVWARNTTGEDGQLRVAIVYANNIPGDWAVQEIVNPPHGLLLFTPRISVTAEGRTVIVHQGRDLYSSTPTHRVYTWMNDSPGGVLWQCDSLDLLGASTWFDKKVEQVAVNRLGEIHLVFSGTKIPIEDGVHWIYHLSRNIEDSTWSVWQLLTEHGTAPQMHFDTDLHPHVLFHYAYVFFDWDIGYAYYDGYQWQVQKLIDASYPDDTPDGYQFVIDTQGYPHLVYDGYGGLYAYGHIPYEDLTIGDVVYLINYIFNQGDEPCSFTEFDVDCTGFLNISDAVYMIRYIWEGGDAPCFVD